MEDNKNLETEAKIPDNNPEAAPQETSVEVVEEILEDDAKELPAANPAPEAEKASTQPEETFVKDEPQPEPAAEPGVPPRLPREPRVKTPWTRSKISMTVCFILAGLLYLGALISGIFTAVQSVDMMPLQEFEERYEIPDFDSDFFDNDFFYDEGYGNSGMRYQNTMTPVRSQNSARPSAAKDYTVTFGLAICGTLFACTGILLLNKEQD